MHLQEASLIKEAADVTDDGRPPDKDVAHRRVHNCVQVPLAIPRLLHQQPFETTIRSCPFH